MDFLASNWIEIFLTFISFFLIGIYRKMVITRAMAVATQEGVRLLIKNQIIEKYFIYKDRGYIFVHEKELLLELYDEYTILDGNGMVSGLIDDIDKIPIK